MESDGGGGGCGERICALPVCSVAVRTSKRMTGDSKGGQSAATVVAPLAAILRAQPASYSSQASLQAISGYTHMGSHQPTLTPTSTWEQRAPPPPYVGCVCAGQHRSCRAAGGHGGQHRAGGGDTLRGRAASPPPRAPAHTHHVLTPRRRYSAPSYSPSPWPAPAPHTPARPHRKDQHIFSESRSSVEDKLRVV